MLGLVIIQKKLTLCSIKELIEACEYTRSFITLFTFYQIIKRQKMVCDPSGTLFSRTKAPLGLSPEASMPTASHLRRFLLRFPKLTGAAIAAPVNFDRGANPCSLYPPPAALASVAFRVPDKNEAPHAGWRVGLHGDPSGTRTPDTLIKSQVLYHLS